MNKPLLKTIAARPGTALGEQDIHLFREGTHSRLHQKLGCHLHATGARFALWAPNARSVSVIGDFNAWNVDADQAQARADGSGIWELDVRGVEAGQRYKFAVFTQTGERLEKADPFAFRAELAPGERVAIPGGTLIYERLSTWMGYRVSYNATLPWLLAAIRQCW